MDEMKPFSPGTVEARFGGRNSIRETFAPKPVFGWKKRSLDLGKAKWKMRSFPCQTFSSLPRSLVHIWAVKAASVCGPHCQACQVGLIFRRGPWQESRRVPDPTAVVHLVGVGVVACQTITCSAAAEQKQKKPLSNHTRVYRIKTHGNSRRLSDERESSDGNEMFSSLPD